MNSDTRRIAFQRIQTLFCLAEKTFKENPSLAQRYVYLARRIAMSARIRLPTKYRRQICRHCKSYIRPGANCRVRIQRKRKSHVVITCLCCGKKMRIPIKNRKVETKNE